MYGCMSGEETGAGERRREWEREWDKDNILRIYFTYLSILNVASGAHVPNDFLFFKAFMLCMLMNNEDLFDLQASSLGLN